MGAVTTTKLTDIINPEVMGDMINAKLKAQAKFLPYAHVDTTLEGVPGDTKTVPSWGYIGDAEDFDPETAADTDAEIKTSKLTATSAKFGIKCAAKSVSILQTALNSGLGNPVGAANTQLAKSMIQKMDNDVITAALGCETIYNGGDGTNGAVLSYNTVVDAVSTFEDEEDGIDKVMFINPKQYPALLKDPSFLSADKFKAGVAVHGAIGMIAGCWIKKSKKVALDETSHFYKCPIIKLEADSAETECTEDELPALTIFMKKEIEVSHEWLPKKQKHDITATKYYGVALTNAAKVVVAHFKK